MLLFKGFAYRDEIAFDPKCSARFDLIANFQALENLIREN